MTTQQSEALRLADAVRTHDDHPRVHFYNRVAAELRRLHAESEQHLQELRSYRITVENREARIVDLEAKLIAEAARTADYKQGYEQINKQHSMLAARYAAQAKQGEQA